MLQTLLDCRDCLKSVTWRKNDATAIVRDLEQEESLIQASVKELETAMLGDARAGLVESVGPVEPAAKKRKES